MYYCQLFIDGVVRNLSEISSGGERGELGVESKGGSQFFSIRRAMKKMGTHCIRVVVQVTALYSISVN